MNQNIICRVEEIQLKSGRILHLHELNFLDFRDGEHLLGRPLEKWFDKDDASFSAVKTLGIFLWLCSRKDGISKADQIAGKWAFSLDVLLCDLTDGDIERHQAVILSFFGRSGASEKSGLPSDVSVPASRTMNS